ncbi:inorganic diphosphatase [Alteribacter populi]|uniref:inorganic diphosphatase n=1 Tax=Alteribacter populi TaxID=2011011 RepID=UPI0018E3AF93
MKVKGVVVRQLGTKYPRYKFIYPINYGYIPNTKAEDGEEIDAYVLEESTALSEYEGKVIGNCK